MYTLLPHRNITSSHLFKIGILILFLNFAYGQSSIINGKPTLVIYPNNQANHVPAHTGFVLTCKGENDHPSAFDRLEWYGPNDKVALSGGGIIKSRGSIALKFAAPTVEDSGNYTCRAIYHGSDPLEATVNVDFYIDIKMDCPEQQALILNRTDQKFFCLVSARPAPSIEWQKDDKSIGSSDAATDQRYKYDQEGYMNIVGPVTESDGGIYTIRAYVLTTGKLQERKITVEIHTEPQITNLSVVTSAAKIEAQSKEQFEIEALGVEGELQELKCQAEGKPQPLIYWISPQKRNLSLEGGYVVDIYKGTLKIERVRKDRDEGLFECLAENGAGQSRKSLRQIVGQRPTIVSFENQTIDENGSVMFECRVRGFPAPRITIRRENFEPFKKGDFLYEQEFTQQDADTSVYRLRLGPSLNRTFDGNYFCAGENFAGRSERVGKLKIKFRPDLESTPKRQVYVNSQLAQITCVVRAYPDPIITWWKDGIQLTGNEYTFSRGPDGSTNVLSMKANPSIVRGVLGDYDCVATNEKGESRVRIRFEEARRPGMVTSAHVLRTTPTTVELAIDPPIDDGGLRLINYHINYSGAVRYDPVTGGAGGEFLGNRMLPSGSTTASGKELLPYAGPKSTYLIRNLRPGFRYTMQIKAENELGLSLDSGYAIQVETLTPSAPDAPIPTSPSGIIGPGHQIVSKYSDGYRLNWAPPQFDNGSPIIKYRIKYYPVTRSLESSSSGVGDEIWKFAESVAPKEYVHNPNRDLKFDIYSFEPGKHYKIEIRAENSYGISKPAGFIVSTPLNGLSLSDSDGLDNAVAVSAWFSDFAPPNYVVILLLFGGILVFIITEFTCYFLYQVGLIYFVKNTCCTPKPKSMMADHS